MVQSGSYFYYIYLFSCKRATKSTAGSYERLCNEVPIGVVTPEIGLPPMFPPPPPPAPPLPCEPLISGGGINDDPGVIMSPPVLNDRVERKLFGPTYKDVIVSRCIVQILLSQSTVHLI